MTSGNDRLTVSNLIYRIWRLDGIVHIFIYSHKCTDYVEFVIGQGPFFGIKRY